MNTDDRTDQAERLTGEGKIYSCRSGELFLTTIDDKGKRTTVSLGRGPHTDGNATISCVGNRVRTVINS
ncbi:hypothetical protein [Nocardia sp. NPDC127526]|uniref:hypothetical protein n=1 Tax=Nocardia sp. NPDC127526 TaxID=3345393 RepID=UPI003645DDB6